MAFTFSSIGLPNLHRWDKLFYKYCYEIGDKIIGTAEKVMNEALREEIRMTMKDKYGMNENTIEGFFEDAMMLKENNKTQAQLTVDIDVSFDMGWQKRSTGRNFNSCSGHAFLIGMSTKKNNSKRGVFKEM